MVPPQKSGLERMSKSKKRNRNECSVKHNSFVRRVQCASTETRSALKWT